MPGKSERPRRIRRCVAAQSSRVGRVSRVHWANRAKAWSQQLASGVKPNLRRALIALLALMSAGLPVAAEPLPTDGPALYRDKQYGRAVPVLREAAQAGDAESQFYLALAYHHGKGLIADGEEALVWYRAAAAQTHARALFNLATIYHRGELVPADMTEALAYYEAAARLNDKRALSTLGVMHYRGDGVPRDLDKARSYWEAAAELGSREAMYDLGLLYVRGRGVPEDPAAAFVWFEKAAYAGMVRAQTLVAQSLVGQAQSAQDLIEAWAWFHLAAEGGSRTATQGRDLLEMRMAEADIVAAEARAAALAEAIDD